MSVQGLVCPRCKDGLAESGNELTCRPCGASYRRVGGVPLLLPEFLSPQQLSQTEYFDSEFAGYDERYAPENWRLSFSRRIIRALSLDEGRGPYLDVGVGGSGATVIEVARLGVDATGCDLSVPGVVHAARLASSERVDARARFVACAAESLPFANAAFGAASAVAVLEHLDNDSAAIGELARVVRPGGRVWITVPLAYRYMLPLVWPIYYRHDRKLGHKRHYDEADLARRLEPAGFRRVETTYTGHVVKILQLAATRVPLSTRRRDRLWWALERMDLRAAGRPYGALQLNAVFERT